MSQTILAIGGHVGDAELTSGGVLATCAAAGGKIATLALTGGEKGVPKGRDIAEYRAQKVQEAEAFAKKLGGTAKVLDYPDGTLELTNEVCMQVCDFIREVKPDLILTHHEFSMHKDHAMCHRIVKDAWFYAAQPGFERERPAHFGRLLFAENWEDSTNFKPYLYKEVSEEGFKLWQDAIQTHWFAVNASFPYFEYYSHLMRLRGIEARKAYAEAFMVLPEENRVIDAL